MSEILEVNRSARNLPDYQHTSKVRSRTNKNGEVLMLPTYDDYVALGMVFSANVGTGTTPIVFATTTYDENQPEFGLDVPAGVTCIPLTIDWYFETVKGTLSESFFRMDDGLLGVGTSVAITPNNMYQQASDSQLATPQCTARSLYTGDTAAITTGPEFARHGAEFVVATAEGGPLNRFHWSRFADGHGPIAEGEASFSGYAVAVGTAPTGYLTVTWAEYTT